MDELRIDPRDGKPRPCQVCESEINELINDYDREAIYPYDLITNLKEVIGS